MTQLGIDLIVQPGTPTELWEESIRGFIRNYKIGSVLGSPAAGGRPEAILSPDALRKIVFRINEIAIEEGVLPLIYGIDSIHGGTFIDGSTLFPQQINAGASFNRTAAAEVGRITAKDTRASGVPWNFSPVLDLCGNKLWSRVWETYGEDPFLAAELGAANIRAAQGGYPRNLANPVTVAATAKHFIGYGMQENGDKSAVKIPDRQLLQYHVPSFDAAIAKADVATVMESYNEINGVPVVASRQYLVDLLRTQLKFNGLLVTDWSEINHLVNWHKTAANTRDATYQSIDASSVDMSMVPWSVGDYTRNLIDLVNEGFINITRIDESVERILAIKDELGLLDNPFLLPPQEIIDSIGSEEDREIARQIAAGSIVLLKNENNLLPLNINNFLGRRIAVIGPTGNSLRRQNGGWTIAHQGGQEEDFPFGSTVYTGLQEYVDAFGGGNVEITFSEGCEIDSTECSPLLINAAVAAAQAADVVILCLGEDSYAEFPGNIYEIEIALGQQELARAVTAVGKPTVLILIEGRPRSLNGINNLVDAIFFAALPGSEGGLAIARLLFGSENPSARLPLTYPKHKHSPIVTYYHKNSDSESFDPEWTFGQGLSYTSFEYTDLIVPEVLPIDAESFEVSVIVRNVGSRPGAVPVLLFVQDAVRTITPEVRMLKGFDKIYLNPNNALQVRFSLSTAETLAFYGIDMNLQIEEGEFIITVGDLSATMNVIASSSSSLSSSVELHPTKAINTRARIISSSFLSAAAKGVDALSVTSFFAHYSFFITVILSMAVGSIITLIVNRRFSP